MHLTGQLIKMITEYDSPIQYYLNFNDEIIMVNQLLNKKIKICFDHYKCLGCGLDKEIFAMGYCKDWIIRPELSKAHLGKEDRNLTIETQAQLQPHLVYIANSGGIKVGVTRKSQLPFRWIDQGAEYAIKLAETENRYEAGVIELILKNHISDKTNYRKMLREQVQDIDLSAIKNELIKFIPENLTNFVINDNEIFKIKYPVIAYPHKVNSINLKKVFEFDGVLKGIKGQYLIFDNNIVFNIRNHEGFVINLIL
jgi:hypothetical protein